MVNATPSPKSRAILVILQKTWEDRALLDVFGIVRIKTDEEEAGGTRVHALIWLLREVLIQNVTRVRMEHGFG